MFQAIDRFLEDPGVNHLTILGDFGTGKSSCAMELTVRLLDGAVTHAAVLFPAGLPACGAPAIHRHKGWLRNTAPSSSTIRCFCGVAGGRTAAVDLRRVR